ncbi:hypothetical protein F8O07_06715 [Pseudoclavibacter sp. CFCC 13796]|uniref:hypothetical protein n=1 Tax=Pseudoclavibacter sp. CFCC 13796 TaxID=2615179 RepID=UPI0013016D1C|nr:hypothetical protein [Pseudoclavibacter sp. CFCC 13796]KAB1661591.1 hypothetical protein F8O07_06715 [Pseudoclavibacter sp. CFCC 13796]
MTPKPRFRRPLIARDTVTTEVHPGRWVIDAIFRDRDESWRDVAVLRSLDADDHRQPIVRLERLHLA